MSDGEWAGFKRRMDEAKRVSDAARKAEHARAAAEAGEEWRNAVPADPGQGHLKRRGVKPYL